MLSALAIVALLAGVTGTWSPCGLSTIETLRAGGVHGGGRRTAAATSAAFALGAVAGGVVTFAMLSGLGGLLGAGGGRARPLAALVVALAAALLDAAGVRILPQVRRQVPEPWRRRLPVGLAAGMYGVLLGLGFTTFVMSFAVWAIAGMAVALGSLRDGLVLGLCFGAGRALPVLALAPIADLDIGARALDAMTDRGVVLRRTRRAGALALAGCALVLAGPAGAAPGGAAVGRGARAAGAASGGYSGPVDPSVAGGEYAWEQAGVGAFVRRHGIAQAIPGHDPALGGPYLAWRRGADIVVANRYTLAVAFVIPAPRADEIAVSARWLVYRVAPAAGAARGRYALRAARLGPAPVTFQVASAAAPDELGRPALQRSTLVFGAAGRLSRILAIDLDTGRHRVLRAAHRAELLNPSLLGGELLYVHVGPCLQKLELGPAGLGGRDRVLLSAPTQIARDGGYGPGAIREGRTPGECVGPRAGTYRRVRTLWTTALGSRTAYVTVLSTGAGGGGPRRAMVRRVAR